LTNNGTGIGINGSASTTALQIHLAGTGISDGFKMTSSVNTDEDWYYYMDASDNLSIRDDASDVITFENGTGDVGIGTTSPGYNLHVHDDSGTSYMRISDNTTGTSSGLRVGLNGSGNAYILNDYAGELNIGTSGGIDMSINSAGNVGIDNTNPEAKLHVSNGSDAQPGSGGGYVIVGQTSANHMRLDGNEIMVLNGADSLNASTLYINDEGNTNVGTTTGLAAALGVRDEDATGYALRVQVGTATKLNVYDHGGVAIGGNVITGPSDGLYVNNEVCINTTTVATGYMLNVNGKVICEELKVQNSGSWPDYVFADEYDLPTLEEVEAHIEENNHLLGVPDACTVEEEGIMIGQMQKVMMEKIEELTLYMIDANKRIKQLEEENNNLKENK
jgi:hypothetical protein